MNLEFAACAFADCAISQGLNRETAKGACEKALLTNALARSDGNVSQAARLLGIHRNTIERLTKKYEIRLADFRGVK